MVEKRWDWHAAVLQSQPGRSAAEAADFATDIEATRGKLSMTTVKDLADLEWCS